MEYKEYASKGVAGAGLGLGIAGTALGLLGGGSALLNGWNPRYADGCCSENHVVTRYDAEKSARIAQLEGELANKNAEIYTDKKSLELYQYIDGRLRGIEGQLAQQAVYNATNNGLIGCLQGQVAALQGMTKTVIPDSSICPPPMPRYNSWTAPAAGASTGG
jgi:hypothetical protein